MLALAYRAAKYEPCADFARKCGFLRFFCLFLKATLIAEHVPEMCSIQSQRRRELTCNRDFIGETKLNRSWKDEFARHEHYD